MRLRFALLIISVPALLAGQSAVPPGTHTLSGAWRAVSPASGAPWTAVLRVEGRHVIGAVSSCASIGPLEIHDGHVDGNAFSFKCATRDGDRTLTFKGRLTEGAIEFVWDKRVREGGNAWASDPMFGDSSPRTFKATRVSDPPKNVADLAAKARGSTGVSFDRILRFDEPHNWLTYSGNLSGHRYSALEHLTPTNVKDLELAWLHQTDTTRRIQATPLVVDGVMYTVVPEAVIALDAATGRTIWTFPYTTPSGARASGGGGRPNRGLAVLDSRLFLGTVDAHLIALDAFTGKEIWKTTVANFADPACQGQLCYVITHAPLVVRNSVLVGVGGGEGRIRGFVAAFDAETGKEIWRFHTVPGKGDPGNETWPGDSWKTGGVGVWQIGAYDADLNLTYWGTGNPYPALDGSTRRGDNLYSDSVIALDADTGTLRWHYQFTPHDEQDWDAAQVPVLADITWKGEPRKAMLWANRNGLMYLLDRVTGQFLMGKPFVEVNWMTGFDDKGRPLRVKDQVVTPASPMKPGVAATNWWPPSYSRKTGWFYIPAWERGSVKPGIQLRGQGGYGALRAFDPGGEKKWEFVVRDAWFASGILTTASDLLFFGTAGDSYSAPEASARTTGYFYTLDARTGKQLWKMSLAGPVEGSPITYEVQGRQYVAVTAGNTIFALALRQ